MMAPKSQSSGKSQSTTPTGRKIAVEKQPDGFSIDGTPADCIKLGIDYLKSQGKKPDIVISGINAGANLGVDIYRSGTFGAAREALLAGIPSIALSNVDHLEAADHMAERLARPVA